MGRLLGKKPGGGLAPSTYSKDAYPPDEGGHLESRWEIRYNRALR